MTTVTATAPRDDIKLDVLRQRSDSRSGTPKPEEPCCKTQGFLGFLFCGKYFCNWEDGPIILVEAGGTVASSALLYAKMWALGGLGFGGVAIAGIIHWRMRRYRSIANLTKVDLQLQGTNSAMLDTLNKTKAEALEFQKKAERAEGQLKNVDDERAKWAEERLTFQRQVGDFTSQNSTLTSSLADAKQTNSKLEKDIKNVTALLAQYKSFLTRFNEQNAAFLELAKQVDQKNAALSLLDQRIDRSIAQVGEDFKQEEAHLDRAIEQAQGLRDQIAKLLGSQIDTLQVKTAELVQVSDKLEATEGNLKKTAQALEEQRKKESQLLDDLKQNFLAEDQKKEEAIAKQKQELIALRDEVHLEIAKLEQLSKTQPSVAAGHTVSGQLDELLKRQASQNDRIKILLAQASS